MGGRIRTLGEKAGWALPTVWDHSPGGASQGPLWKLNFSSRDMRFYFWSVQQFSSFIPSPSLLYMTVLDEGNLRVKGLDPCLPVELSGREDRHN